MKFDIRISNAKTRDSQGKNMQIGIAGGTILKIAEKLNGEARQEIDAKGNLVSESFVNGHLHLDKVYTLEMVGQDALNSYHGEGMGGAMTAIEQASRVKDTYDESWIIENVRRAALLAVKYGNTHIRAFADVDTKGKLEGVKALIKAREEFKDRVEIQIVAFPQDGIIRDPGAAEYVEEALKLGADVVGGIPWIEFTDEDTRSHVDQMIQLAVKYNKPVSMLVDDAGDPNLRTIEYLAVQAIKNGLFGKVTAQHARAMALYPEPTYRKLEALLLKSGMGLVSNPHTGPLHARVKDLYAAGVPVALAQDDIADAYYPFGRNNMLEIGFLAVHLLWMTGFEQMEKIYDMITTKAALALGIKGHELKEGNPANLVVLKQENVWKALLEHEAPAYVIKSGKDITLID
ncbi:MAG: amidohydrolase family protein [Spirochaetia bacterium]|nr:amidohydrolase family protein [Spirochaetia bacterium]